MNQNSGLNVSSKKSTNTTKNSKIPKEHSSLPSGSAMFDEEEEEEMEEKSSSSFSDTSEREDSTKPISYSGGKIQRIMLKKMMLKLYKILCQTAEISDLRLRLKSTKQIKMVIVNLVKPSVQTKVVKIQEPAFTCPITQRVYDNLLDMLVITQLSHHDVHIKAQIREKGLTVLNYEIGNSNTFPSLGPESHYLHPTKITSALSIYETKVKVFARAKIAKNISKSPLELDRLMKRVGFTQSEQERFSKSGQGQDFFSNRMNHGRLELFQYRLLRALIQNMFPFELLTSDTLIGLSPYYDRNNLNPIVKFKAMNFFNKTISSSGNIPSNVYKKSLAKYSRKFDALVEKNNVFRSFPIGHSLQFNDLLVDSEYELDYSLPEHLQMKTLATNPNLTSAERLVIILYNKTFNSMLQKYDHLGASCLISMYPLPVSTFPGQIMKYMCDRLQGDIKKQMAGAVQAVCSILRLAGFLNQMDFEEVMAWAGCD